MKKSGLRTWVGRLKWTAIIGSIIGGFVGMLVYFFFEVSAQYPPPDSAAPFVSDPKKLNTNSIFGSGLRQDPPAAISFGWPMLN